MSILALDLGTKTGWALSTGQSGVWDFKLSKFDSAGQRYVGFRHALIEKFLINDVKKVYYEEVRMHTAVDAAHVYGGMVAILQSTCLENNIEYQGVPVGTIKKHATGKGNADKDAMVKAAVQKFKGIDVKDHNHADALWILDYTKSSILY